jgi:hypothetical protein
MSPPETPISERGDCGRGLIGSSLSAFESEFDDRSIGLRDNVPVLREHFLSHFRAVAASSSLQQPP